MKKKKRLTAILTAGLMLFANIPEIWNPLLKTEIVADAVNEDVNINLDVRYESSETLGVATYGIITAYDGQGGLLWEYTTDKYGATELQIVSEIGTKDNAYYFVECGTVVAMDVQTGEVLWKNSDFSGASANFAFGENAIYMCGFYGPDFYAISYSGETLTRIEHLDPDFSSSRYYWPHDIEIIGKYAVIRFEANNDEELYVDLETYEVLKSIDEDVRSGKCGDNAYWSLENGTLTISGTGEMESYLNDRNDNPDATKSPWYKYADEVKKVVIEEGIARTGWGALTDFPNLTEIEFPDSLEVIDRGSFYSCTSLESVVIPENVMLSPYVFGGCSNLKSITFLGNKGTLPSHCFNGCSETLEVYFKGTEEEWKNFCNAMVNVDLANARFHSLLEEDPDDSEITEGKCGDNAYWKLDENGTFRAYGSGDMYDYSSKEAPWYDIKDNVNNIVVENGIASVGMWTFTNFDNITDLTLPESIKTIGYGAFANCSNLKNIVIPDSISEIYLGGFCFYNCIDLKEFNTPCILGRSTFNGCTNIESIKISEKCTGISDEAFLGCTSLKDIVIPDGVERMAKWVFIGCSNLKSITIPNSMELIRQEAFTGCENLKDVYFLGTKAEWEDINIFDDNEELLNADIHFKEETSSDNYFTGYGTFRFGVDTYSITQGEVENAFNDKKIPFKLYKEVLGYSPTLGLFKLCNDDNISGGACAGFPISAISINSYGFPPLDGYSKDCLYDVKWYDRNIINNHTAYEQIAMGYIYHRTITFAKELTIHGNHMNDLYKNVEKFCKGKNKGVYIAISGQALNDEGKLVNAGHALLALGIKENNANYTKIAVYDCNHPDKERYLTLTKDEKGKFNGWEYDLGFNIPTIWGSGRKNARVSYVVNNVKFSENTLYGKGLKLISVSYNLYDSVLECTTYKNKYKLSPYMEASDEILPILTDNIYEDENGNIITSEHDYDMYWVDTDSPLTFYNTEKDGDIALYGDEIGIAVNLPANSELNLLVDDDAKSYADIIAENDEQVIVTYQTMNEEKDDIIPITINAKGTLRTSFENNTLTVYGTDITISDETQDFFLSGTDTYTFVVSDDWRKLENSETNTTETTTSTTTEKQSNTTTAAAPSGSQTGGNGGNSSSGSGSSKDNSPKTGDDINKIYGLLLLSAAVAVALRKRRSGN